MFQRFGINCVHMPLRSEHRFPTEPATNPGEFCPPPITLKLPMGDLMPVIILKSCYNSKRFSEISIFNRSHIQNFKPWERTQKSPTGPVSRPWEKRLVRSTLRKWLKQSGSTMSTRWMPLMKSPSELRFSRFLAERGCLAWWYVDDARISNASSVALQGQLEIFEHTLP